MKKLSQMNALYVVGAGEQWEHRTCASIKQNEFVMLESPSKNIFSSAAFVL